MILSTKLFLLEEPHVQARFPWNEYASTFAHVATIVPVVTYHGRFSPWLKVVVNSTDVEVKKVCVISPPVLLVSTSRDERAMNIGRAPKIMWSLRGRLPDIALVLL